MSISNCENSTPSEKKSTSILKNWNEVTANKNTDVPQGPWVIRMLRGFSDFLANERLMKQQRIEAETVAKLNLIPLPKNKPKVILSQYTGPTGISSKNTDC